MRKFLCCFVIITALFCSPAESNNFVEGWQSLNISCDCVEFNGQKFNRVLAVGDIHGQFSRFMSMYKKLNVSDSDLVIFLGDYIQGKKTGEELKTIQWLMEQSRRENFILLSGNKEREFLRDNNKNWALLRELNSVNDPELTKKVYEFFAGLKFYQELTIDGRDFVFAHAGINDDGTINPNDEFSLMFNKRFCRNYHGNKFVVIGHRPTQSEFGKKITVPVKVSGKNILMLDTNCKRKKGYSSCVNILTGEFWQSDKDF